MGQRSIRIVDFGSGAIADGKIHKLTGTPLYMSPEQIPILEEFRCTGQLPETKYNPFKSDVYSLGVTFLQMALMETPVQLLEGDREAAITGYLGCIRSSYPILHDALWAMLNNDPDQRPDFPQIIEYLKDPSMLYFLTVSSKIPEAMSVPYVPQPQQCPWCSNYFLPEQLQQVQYQGAIFEVCQYCQQLYHKQMNSQEIYSQVKPAQQSYGYPGTGQEFAAGQYRYTPPQRPSQYQNPGAGQVPDQAWQRQMVQLQQELLVQCEQCGTDNQIFVPSDGIPKIWFCETCYASDTILPVASS